LEGLHKWRKERLIPPVEVEQATASYRREMDVLGQFLDDCCTLHPAVKVGVGDLYKRYLSYCRENGDEPLGKKQFGQQLSARGDGSITAEKGKDGWGWFGVSLREKVRLLPSEYVDR
jgi:putative DNA primase/helicase